MSLRFLIGRWHLLGIMLILGASVGRVSAHAELVRSEPAANATLAAAPQQIMLEFSQLLDPAKSTITVMDAAGTTVSQGNAEVITTNNKALRVALKPNLAPGVYSVEWSNLSAEDGEEESSSFTFTIGAQGTSGTTPSTSGNPGETPPSALPATGATPGASLDDLMTGIALVLVIAGMSLRSGWKGIRRTTDREVRR